MHALVEGKMLWMLYGCLHGPLLMMRCRDLIIWTDYTAQMHSGQIFQRCCLLCGNVVGYE